MALFRRFFYRKLPDRLLEISDRIYVFDSCFSTDVLDVDEKEVYLDGIVAQLQDYYPDASYIVFNFTRDDTSQLSNILSKHDMTVMNYPEQYEGCPLLPMEMIHHFLCSTVSWLSLEGSENVLLMHCERGCWPVLAFMLAALLLYQKQYTSEQKTLEMVYKQAPRELVHLLSAFDPRPSQLRYLQYIIARRNIGLDWPPADSPLVLDCVIHRDLPLFDGGRGYRPLVRVYGQDPSTAFRNSKLLFSSSRTLEHCRLYQPGECALVKIDIHQCVRGDVVLECVHLNDDFVKEEMVFIIMFHTAYILSNILMLTTDEVDVLCDAKDMLPKDFRVEVLSSDAGVVTPIMNLESEDNTGNESSRETEYFEVEEIFINVVNEKVHDMANISTNGISLAGSHDIGEMVVSLSDEEEEIIGCLMRGSSQRDIVSIVGMGGIGKTTLAKKVYDDPKITHHFHRRAWCSVTQVYGKREMLLDIIKDIQGLADEIHQMSDTDLELKLFQKLKKIKYLIVMDDMWDITALNELVRSFPDDGVGSQNLDN